MRDRLLNVARPIAVRLAVLGMFYWALVLHPPTQAAPVHPNELSMEVAQHLVESATAAIRSERYADAKEPLGILIRTYPNNHIYLGQLADLAHRTENFVEEAKYWERFVQVAPRPFEACPYLGQAYWHQELIKEAVGAFERCYDFDRSDPDAVFYLAQAYERTQRYDEAQKLYETGRSLDVNNLDMHIGLARLDLHRLRNDRAKEASLAILAKAPKTVDAMLILGLANQRQGNNREARKYLEQGLALKETYSDFHLALGMLDEEEQRVSQAIEHFERVLALEGSNNEAARRLNRLRGQARR